MTRAIVNSICGAFPGSEVSDPWGGGHGAWKVGGKMFACVGSEGRGVAVKTPDIETAEMLIAAGAATKAAYFHRSWVFLPWELCDEDVLRHRLGVSYDTIRGGLTKKAQAALSPREG